MEIFLLSAYICGVRPLNFQGIENDCTTLFLRHRFRSEDECTQFIPEATISLEGYLASLGETEYTIERLTCAPPSTDA